MRGLFGAIAAGAREVKVTDITDLTWSALFGGPSSKAGVAVNIDTALRVSTVLACARVLANGIATAPFKLYHTAADGSKTLATDNSVFKLLRRRPNEWMTAFELRQTLLFHAVLTGRGYAYIGRVGDEVRELIPLQPGRVVARQGADYTLTYDVSDASGLIATLPRTSVLHIRGPSWNGYEGMDALHLAREAIGLAIATEEAHARLHSNGVQPGGLITVDQGLSPEARDRIKVALNDHSGPANKFKTMVLDKGAAWQPFAMNGVDAQHLETRKHQIEEICRTMGVFPQMIGHTANTATFASAEAFFQAHVTHSLQPWVECFEQAVERDLLDNDEAYTAKLDMRGLLRGDFKTRTEGYARALGAGGGPAYMTQDEVRALEDLDPMGGDAAKLPQPTNVSTGGGPQPSAQAQAQGA